MIMSMTNENNAEACLKLWKAAMALHQYVPCDELLQEIGTKMAADETVDAALQSAWLPQCQSRLLHCIDTALQPLLTAKNEIKPPRVVGRGQATEAMRAVSDRLRRLLDDQASPMEQNLADRIRERLLANSKLANRVRNLCEDLVASDLLLEPTGRSLRLRLNSEAVARISGVVKNSITEYVDSDIAWMNSQWTTIHAQTKHLVTQAADFDLELRSGELNTQEILDWLQPDQAINFRYSGELPHRTFMDRISYGRRPVFVVMMVMSLIGAAFGAGRGLTAYLAPAVLVLFILGVIWTYHSFEQEREMLIDRELSRLREVIATELSRRLEELLKEWHGRANRWLRDQQKSLVRQCEDQLKAWADRPEAAKADELKAYESTLSDMETTITKLQNIRQQLA